eukprot:g3856.t1
MNEHGAACGDGLVNGGSAGLSDGEVVGVQQLGDFSRPAEETDTAGEFVFDFLCPRVEVTEIFSHHDGEFHIGVGIEDGAAVAADEWFFRGGEVKYPEGVTGVLWRDGGEGGEGWIDREAGGYEFFLGDAPAAHGLECQLIGDKEVIGGSAEPGCVDFYGIGDDGEDGSPMAKEKGKVELRPIDEETSVEEDVIRLHKDGVSEVAGKGPEKGVEDSEKSLGAAERRELKMRPRDPGLDELIQANPAVMEGAENEWVERPATDKRPLWSWVVVFLILLGAGILWSVTQVGRSQKEHRVLVAQAEQIVEKEKAAEAEAEKLIATITETVRRVLEAGSVEEMLQYVRHPGRVEALMLDYYSREPFVSLDFMEVAALQPITVEKHASFWGVGCRIGGGGYEQVLVEVLDDGEVKLDWETLVLYQPMDWNEFYCVALLRLTDQSTGMANKFSALARDKYMDFLVLENLYVLLAYGILAVCFAFVLQPFVCLVCSKYRVFKGWKRFLPAVIGAFLIHGYFTLRLVETRPYFLDDAKFGYWYYEILNVVPDVAKPVVFGILFSVLPVVVLVYAFVWHWRGWSGIGRVFAGISVVCAGGIVLGKTGIAGNFSGDREVVEEGARMNVIVIGSDSLRGDKLGYAGYEPRRKDGLAAGGVSPVIDELAGRSVVLENCYTPIASTLESGTSMMASQYPNKHGFRHMYPNEERVRQTQAETEPIAAVLARKGYDTAVFGDWCAGYFELMPLGFEHVSVSSFDNFKIYMSQAVMMAHFVVPLYFDHPVGYAIFPQLGSFAQFVTPDVVTERVEERLANVSKSGDPFFWHVFYSCNHLPYRNPEPYSSMFTDPDYTGPNRNGVDFDIDSFIGGTDLENKWKVLPEKEIQQIRDLYDGCTRQFDDHVGKILAALEKNGLAENTIIVITADHGDNLYEEGVTLGHGLTFNGELHANHVPLVVHVPGGKAGRVEEIMRTIDIAPTITQLLGVEKPESWQGRSVAGWIDGSETPEDRAYYGETGFPFIQFRVAGVERPKLPSMDQMTEIVESFNYQFVLKEEYEGPLVTAKQRCLMTKEWKLICTPTADGGRHYDLFHYAGKGYEKVEAVGDNQPEFASMRVALEKWMDEGIETPASEIFPDP